MGEKREKRRKLTHTIRSHRAVARQIFDDSEPSIIDIPLLESKNEKWKLIKLIHFHIGCRFRRLRQNNIAVCQPQNFPRLGEYVYVFQVYQIVRTQWHMTVRERKRIFQDRSN